MDISTLKDVGLRKKICKQADILKKKISEETKNIIKLKVDQDASYWEVCEKLSTTEQNHERLQKNMVELQMQYETVSAQYQEETRKRHEVSNMLMGNRKLYAVLEENLRVTRAVVQRMSADRTALAEAYAQATEKVNAAQSEHEKQVAAISNAASSAQECAKMKEEHCSRLSECMALINCRAEKSCAELDRVREHRDRLADKIARCETVIQEKDNTIQELREEVQRAETKYTDTAAELQKEAGVMAALREALAQAESRTEVMTRDTEQLTSDLSAANDSIQNMKTQEQELQSNVDELKRNISYLTNKNEEVVNELNLKKEELQTVENALIESKRETQAATERISQLIEEHERKHHEFKEHMTTLKSEYAKKCDRQNKENEEKLKTALTRIAEGITRQQSVFEHKISAFECRLNDRNESIARLKLEIEELIKQRDESQAIITDLKSTLERARAEKDEHIAQLERSLAEKEELVSRFENESSIEKQNITNATATIEEQKAELQRKTKDFEQRESEFEKQLAERNEANAQLQLNLTAEKEKVKRAEDVLATTRAELTIARSDVAHALDNVRRLEASVRSKDDEASKQMKIILTARAENDQLQEKIRGMQDTINDIQKITNGKTHGKTPGASTAPPRRDAPELDVSAKPPTTPAQRGTPVVSTAPPRRQLTPADIDMDAIYSIMSDTDYNNTDDLMDGARRFGGSSRAGPPSSSSYKRKQSKNVAPVSGPASDYTNMKPEQKPEAQTEPVRKFFKSRRGPRDLPKKN